MSQPRSAVQESDRWNIEALYPSLQVWRNDFEKNAATGSPRWPKLAAYQGTLGQGADQLKKALDEFFRLDRQISKLYTYAHLKHDEDITENTAKTAYVEALGAYHDFAQEISWFEPELLALDETLLASYLESPILQEYRFHLEKLVRTKPHILSADKELLMAMAGKALSSAPKAFSALNDADFKFPAVLDSQGKELELTHARYGVYMQSHDRTLRENAFNAYYNQYKNYENTLTELLNGQIQTHVFNARARGFKTSLEASLFPHAIDVQVYHSLIEAVHSEIDALHRYLDLRKEVLKVPSLRFFDMQVPLVTNFEMKIPYDEAMALTIESAAPLGDEYQSILEKGLKQQRWVDRFENKNKRSGGYSSGCYDSNPYILMNYKNILRDVYTLAHEAGHSMHSYYSRKSQPYCYSNYSIFVAEVASTFQEELLMQTMLKNAKSVEEKIYLITQKIEDIRATLYRQTQFAEFELMLHNFAENNIPITPDLLNSEYLKLNTFYYGSMAESDPIIGNEWSRIPHFYYNFYVYQYSTGISAALALADQVLKGGAKDKQAYIDFLKSGGSVYPLDALKIAGIDMRSVDPVKKATKKFRLLLDELEKLVLPQKKLALK